MNSRTPGELSLAGGSIVTQVGPGAAGGLDITPRPSALVLLLLAVIIVLLIPLYQEGSRPLLSP